MLRSGFFWKLYAGYSALILISCAIVGIMISQRVGNDVLAEIRQSLKAQAILLEEATIQGFAQADDAAWQVRIRALGAKIDARFTIIRADGVVIADSNENPAEMDNHADRSELHEAQAKGLGTAIRFSNTLRMNMMYLALPVQNEGRLLGYIRTALPLSAIDQRLNHIRSAVVLGAGLSALLALLLGLLVTRHFVQPLASMTTVAESMSCGDYDKRLPVSRKDEIGELARAFNRMAESCRERTDTIVADRNKLSAILSGMTEGVVAVNQDERVVHLNQAAAALLGATPKECLNEPIWQVTRMREVSEILGDTLRDKTDAQRSLRIATSSSDRLIEMHASPLHDGQGKVVGAVAVLHDVSELHRLETVRREFVANASHELKTPITAIRGLVETLIDDKELEPEQRDRFLEKIKDQSLRLSSIVTDLLTLSRLESDGNQSAKATFDLRDVVIASVKDFMLISEERGIALETQLPDVPLETMGDEEALCQVVSNLLDNALKYTPENGRVWARLERRDDYGVIEVQDTGIGIEPKDRNRIFERFYRVDKARSRELGGTGLGLSIVKHIALSHGGHVTVDSDPGMGSVFRVFIPLASTSK
ncbi:HAMP domain-containing protein [Candidatus Sumerlaeota bacterium]|nr:HAMP domain-containing protein [Candidatus Sumerlaeota bacterium]